MLDELECDQAGSAIWLSPGLLVSGWQRWLEESGAAPGRSAAGAAPIRTLMTNPGKITGEMVGMTSRWMGFATAALAVFATHAAWADGDATAGAAIFKKCAVCHSPDAGVNKVGPSLHG